MLERPAGCVSKMTLAYDFANRITYPPALGMASLISRISG
jgi:hypothetical protein